MRTNLKCRPLPMGMPAAYSLHNDAIGWASISLRRLYDQLVLHARSIPALNIELGRTLLLHHNLARADAELMYRGTCDTLLKTRSVAQQVIKSASKKGVGIRFDFNLSVPDLESLTLEPLPPTLGAAEAKSEWDEVSRVRNQLDGLYQDAIEWDDRVEVALLWASLPRAEAEIEFCGTTSTLNRISALVEATLRRLHVEMAA